MSKIIPNLIWSTNQALLLKTFKVKIRQQCPNSAFWSWIGGWDLQNPYAKLLFGTKIKTISAFLVTNLYLRSAKVLCKTNESTSKVKNLTAMSNTRPFWSQIYIWDLQKSCANFQAWDTSIFVFCKNTKFKKFLYVNIFSLLPCIKTGDQDNKPNLPNGQMIHNFPVWWQNTDGKNDFILKKISPKHHCSAKKGHGKGREFRFINKIYALWNKRKGHDSQNPIRSRP